MEQYLPDSNSTQLFANVQKVMMETLASLRVLETPRQLKLKLFLLRVDKVRNTTNGKVEVVYSASFWFGSEQISAPVSRATWHKSFAELKKHGWQPRPTRSSNGVIFAC